MRKILIIILIICTAAKCFAQSQSILDIINNRSDFHIFRSDSMPADTLKFYNESSVISPVIFAKNSNDEKVVSLYFSPFSYAETKETNASFDISEIFGEVTIETYSLGFPVKTILGDNITLYNGSSKISFISYPKNDMYIILHSGKISVSFARDTLVMIAGETLVIHQNGTYSYMDHFDYDLCRNRIISDIISDRQTLTNDIRSRMSAIDDTSTLSYRKLWITRRFLEEY